MFRGEAHGGAPALDAEAFDDRARAAHARIDAAASRLLAERWEVSAEARRAVAARRVNDALEGVAELALAIARLAQPAGAAAARAGDELDGLARLVQGTRIAGQVAGIAGGPAPDSSPAGSACPAS